MRSFLLHAFLFIALISSALAAYVWMNGEFFPAPKLSRNVSLNEQLSRVKKVKEGDWPYSKEGRVNILAIGSSMALNNLHSQAVVDHFKDSSYLNTGIWGARISQTLALASLLIDELKPRTVILVSNMDDWIKGEDYAVDTSLFRRYLTQWNPIESYLHTLKPVFYLREMERNKARAKDPGHFDHLQLDAWGGAPLNVPADRITEDRNRRAIPTRDNVNEDQYKALEDLSEMVASKGCRLIFIQTPYRDGLQTEELRSIVARHEARVRPIVEAHGHTYISTTDRSWPDEMYLDPSHFRADAALEFTRYALGKLE
jgi:hypothetical protein